MNNYITQLSLRGKFLLIAIAMLIPIAGLSFMAVRTEVVAMNFAVSEDEGLDWASELIKVATNLSEYRDHAVAVAFGADAERGEMREHAGLIREGVETLDALMKGGNEKFANASGWSELRARVEMVLAGDGTEVEQIKAIPALISQIHDNLQQMTEVSGLILDPEEDTLALVVAGLFEMPNGIEALASARRAMDLIVEGDTSPATYMQLSKEATLAKLRLSETHHYLATNYNIPEHADSKLPRQAEALKPRIDAVFASMEPQQIGGLTGEAAKKISTDAELLTEELTALRIEIDAELSGLLSERATAAKYKVAGMVALVLLFVLFAFFIQTRVTNYITHKFTVANEVFGKLAEGKFDNHIGEQPADELGQLMLALGKMQGGLAARVDADRKAAEADRARAVATERIKQALDSSSVNVVVADDQHNVIYVNPAAQKLMNMAQADFRQVSMRFDAGRLVGSSLEVFYQDGARQREHIAALRQSETSQFVVGSRTLQATVSPIIDAGGTRIGTVVEWQDRTQEVAAEKEIGSLVSAVSDGHLEQRIELNGKSGFFEVLATGLNGLVSSVSDVVTELNHLVQAANDGDLTRSMDLQGKPGLYVSIGTGVNALVGNMAGVVTRVKSVASEVHAGAQEIAKGNTNLSQRTEEQAANLEETASSMEEMTSTVKQTADNAGQANQLAMAARQQAEKGGAVVSTAVNAMGAINDASKKIADIIGVIDEIAFQTNLLALNAAVEAARAGEQGRGFAVVATEVRNLAGRSATAAKEIKALIQDSVAKVDEGSRLVDESGRTLEEIVMAVKKVTDIVAEIAAASREQSGGIEQVNKAVMQMDETTQQNAALVEEAAAASQAIVEQAHALNLHIARYKVNDDERRTVKAESKPAAAAPRAERRSKDRPWSKPASVVAAKAEAARAVANNGEWSEF